MTLSDPALTEPHFRALFQNTNDAVFFIDLRGRHFEVNQRAAEMFGYTIAELMQMTVGELVVADELASSQHVFAHLVNGGVMPIYERRFRHKNGSIITAEVNVALVRDADGNPYYIQSILRDVTERKRSEVSRLESERLRLELENERDLNHVKSELMVTIAHELRTPLALILLQRDVLDRYYQQLSDAQRKERLAIIRAQVHRLTAILDDLSFLVKGTMSEVERRAARTDVGQFVSQFVTEFRDLLGGKREILVRFSGDLRALCLDTMLMRRILMNLLMNAVKYSAETQPVEISVTRVEQTLQLIVRDHGIGIPAADLPHIFDLFYRGSNARGERGTGLGLGIVAQAVGLSGGTISVQSELGCGSTFTVTMPATTDCEKPDENHLGRLSVQG